MCVYNIFVDFFGKIIFLHDFRRRKGKVYAICLEKLDEFLSAIMHEKQEKHNILSGNPENSGVK